MASQSHEKVYLAELLSDFPADSKLDVEQAITLIQARYTILLQNIDIIGDSLRRGIEIDLVPSIQLPLSALPATIHYFLYHDILSNAGEYRHANEPKSGLVLFGPNQRFSGSSPHQISAEIATTMELLQLESSDPVCRAAEFYQRFVQIHPFYDANGRIGRSIVIAYLDLHDIYMNWEKMERNNKWLKRLNECHKRFGKPTYDKYLNYHVAHWQKFITLKSEIFNENSM